MRINRLRFGTCTKDCFGSCVFIGEWDDSVNERKFLKAKPSISHPFTNGIFCSKLNQRQNLLYHQQRLKHPLIRVNSKKKNNFKQIQLKDALITISSQLTEVIKNFGPASVVGAFSAGNFGLLSRYAPLRFFGKLGGTITSGGICNENGCEGLSEFFGTYSLTNPLQITNPKTKLIVIWGANLIDKNNHAYLLVKKALKNGVKLIVVDSRNIEFMKEAHLVLHPIPGKDNYLALLTLKKLMSLEVFDYQFLQNHVEGYDSIINNLKNLDEEDLLYVSHLNIDAVDKFVDLLSENVGHTIFQVGYGVQKYHNGAEIIQAISLIQMFLGNFGKPGTGLIYSQSSFMKPILEPVINYIKSIPSYSPPPEIELIKLGKSLMDEKYKMIFIYNFNPASSLPNQIQVRKALSREDLYVVVQDLFLNATTKYADIVIPSKFDLESNDVISPYFFPGISINQAGPCPYQECLTNFEFYQRLAWKLGWKTEPIFQENEEVIIKKCIELIPRNIKDTLLKNGYYSFFELNDIPFEDLTFPTTTGHINLNDAHLQLNNNPIEFTPNQGEVDEFYLLSPSHKKLLHSQLGQIHLKILKDFEKVYLNPNDMKRLALKNDEKVIVSNSYGKGQYTVESSVSLRSGVVLIYSGSPLQDSLSVNLFTPDSTSDTNLSGAYNSTRVLISKLV